MAGCKLGCSCQSYAFIHEAWHIFVHITRALLVSLKPAAWPGRGVLPKLASEIEENLGSEPATPAEQGKPAGNRRCKRLHEPPPQAAAKQTEAPKLNELICTNGNSMHTCDLVLSTYEQIRKELTSNPQYVPGLLRIL